VLKTGEEVARNNAGPQWELSSETLPFRSYSSWNSAHLSEWLEEPWIWLATYAWGSLYCSKAAAAWCLCSSPDPSRDILCCSLTLVPNSCEAPHKLQDLEPISTKDMEGSWLLDRGFSFMPRKLSIPPSVLGYSLPAMASDHLLYSGSLNWFVAWLSFLNPRCCAFCIFEWTFRIILRQIDVRRDGVPALTGTYTM